MLFNNAWSRQDIHRHTQYLYLHQQLSIIIISITIYYIFHIKN